MRAIDLYSGVGGWSLGLTLAGFDVVASYDHSGCANETNFKNNHHPAHTVDIRQLDLADLPQDIDVVVGSPPCTEFSFSNRGGGGDIRDGLIDIAKFLEIVCYLKPQYWAMENVPRVAEILSEEMTPRGALRKYRHLKFEARVLNLVDFGLPQKRRRCIAGNIDFDLLEEYRRSTRKLTLGNVVHSLAKARVIDPIYKLALKRDQLVDHSLEDELTQEEVRINRASKVLNLVYNAMPFPDPLTSPVRTITATCTRVSRESVVIEFPECSGQYRRLTIRERACLQGFPITFQFYGTYGQKQKMVGNALPPAFTYFVANSIRSTKVEDLESLASAIKIWSPPRTAIETPPPPLRRTHRYKEDRPFKFAVPGLHLKSGVRFELTNKDEDALSWHIDFIFGTSKSIQQVHLAPTLSSELQVQFAQTVQHELTTQRLRLEGWLSSADITNMQRIWSHRGVGRTTPFMLLDRLSEAAEDLQSLLSEQPEECQAAVWWVLRKQYGRELDHLPGLNKLSRNASVIASGFLLGSWTNKFLRASQRVASSTQVAGKTRRGSTS